MRNNFFAHKPISKIGVKLRGGLKYFLTGKNSSSPSTTATACVTANFTSC